MQTISKPFYNTTFVPSATTTSPSLVSSFTTWCTLQEPNRFVWLGVSLTVHGCFLTPLALYVIMMAGLNFVLFGMAIAAMGMVVVSQLAALPTKYTIPVFLLSLLIDAAVIIAAITQLI
jgi:hypothetical protein